VYVPDTHRSMLAGCFKTDEVLSPKKNSTVLIGSFDALCSIYPKKVVLKKLHGTATEVKQEMNNCRLVQKLARERGGSFCEIISLGTFETTDSWVPHLESSICMLKYDMDLHVLMNSNNGFDLTPAVINSFCASICCSMQLLHAADMVHLDIKPHNLLWKHDTPEQLFLCDFGSMEAQGVSLAQTFVGTVPYASPEQFRQRNVNKSSDVWAFGCSLMQMLSRQPPWYGEENHYQIYLRISNGQLPFDLNVADEHLGEVLLSTARACLQHDQEQRPTFAALNDDFASFDTCTSVHSDTESM
jgi:serine/threonine protein kinase